MAKRIGRRAPRTVAERANQWVTGRKLMRWGNYDTVNDAVRWVSAEVPSGIAMHPNSVPASQTLPASFYAASKPAWYGSSTWPAVGPDVSGGSLSGVGGHVKDIPAKVCYDNSAKDGNGVLTAFNASACYAASGSTQTLIISGSGSFGAVTVK